MGNLFLGKTNYVFPLYQRLGSHELNMIFTVVKKKSDKNIDRKYLLILLLSCTILYISVHQIVQPPLKKKWNALWICMSSFSRGHANLLYIIPVLVSAAEASTFRFFIKIIQRAQKCTRGLIPSFEMDSFSLELVPGISSFQDPVISTVEPGLRISSILG